MEKVEDNEILSKNEAIKYLQILKNKDSDNIKKHQIPYLI